MQSTSERLIAIIQAIPPGSVRSYSSIAAEAGLPNGARQVARLLHSSSQSQNLPWWRVIKADAYLALPHGGGFEEQQLRLRAEGLTVSDNGRVKIP